MNSNIHATLIPDGVLSSALLKLRWKMWFSVGFTTMHKISVYLECRRGKVTTHQDRGINRETLYWPRLSNPRYLMDLKQGCI